MENPMSFNKTKLIILALASFTIGSTQAASVIDFDDVPFPGGDPLAMSYPSAGYQGFDWGGGFDDNSWVISPNDANGWYGGAKEPYSHSGNNFSWSNGGTDLALTVHGGGTFDLASFWVRIWPDESLSLTAHGYLNGSEVFTQAFTATENYAEITTNFTHIDSFTIVPQRTANVLIDDINVANVTAAVPEPETYAMLLTGLGLLGFMARRRKESAV